MKIDETGKSCCGCGACVNVCPKQCITMQSDAEGFLYPIIDECQCIRCSLCTKVCTCFAEGSHGENEPNTYIGFNKNNDIRMKSSSGGLFYLIAEQILNKNGVVYGAAFNDDQTVSHKRIDNISELDKLLTSKYVQSQSAEAFKQVINDLKAGRTVLFCGTPCQVYGVSALAKQCKAEEKLYTVDFICHGVPSPGVWKTYLDYLRDKQGDIQTVEFRNKSRGWHDFCFKIKFKNKTKLIQSHEFNAYMRSFLSNNNLRNSCYECSVKNHGYVSDLTIGDAWKIEKEKPQWADDCGTSVWIVHTDKGKELTSLISPSVEMQKSDYKRWVAFNPSIVESTNKPDSREIFFKKFSEQSPEIFWKVYGQISIKKKLRYIIKTIIRLTGLNKIVRKYF